MSKLEPSKIDLSLYPLVGEYRYPSNAGLLEAVQKALALPAGVHVSNAPRGAGWASLATVGDGAPPTKALVARLRVHGIQPDKKLGEALVVSYVMLDGDEIVAASEDHAFKPPRPARLAFVDASDALVPITDAVREAVSAIASPAAPKATAKAPKADAKAPKADAKAPEADAKAPKADAKAPKADAKASKADAKASKADAKTSTGDAKVERFVFDLPLLQLTVSAQGDRVATTHATSRRVRLFGIDGAAGPEIDAGGNGTNEPRGAAFSPDGARLATGVGDVRIADVASGAELARVEIAKKAQISSLEWREDGLYVNALTPKTSLFVRLDARTFSVLATHEWKRDASMPSVPMLDGATALMTLDTEPTLLRLDLASGKTTRHPLGDRFPGGFYLMGATTEGVWVRARDGQARPLTLLDRQSLATLRVLDVHVPGLMAFAPDGSGLVVGRSSAEGDLVAWHDAKGKERASFGHGDVPGLAERLAALAKARQGTDSLRYLRHEPRPLTQGLAFAGEAIVLASEWTIAVHGRDGALRVRTSG
ncbi:MAG: hypothetical protein U0353_10210 [Sandaracinus sp.]